MAQQYIGSHISLISKSDVRDSLPWLFLSARGELRRGCVPRTDSVPRNAALDRPGSLDRQPREWCVKAGLDRMPLHDGVLMPGLLCLQCGQWAQKGGRAIRARRSVRTTRSTNSVSRTRANHQSRWRSLIMSSRPTVVFRAADVKDLTIEAPAEPKPEPPKPRVPDDPAIMSVRRTAWNSARNVADSFLISRHRPLALQASSHRSSSSNNRRRRLSRSPVHRTATPVRVRVRASTRTACLLRRSRARTDRLRRNGEATDRRRRCPVKRLKATEGPRPRSLTKSRVLLLRSSRRRRRLRINRLSSHSKPPRRSLPRRRCRPSRSLRLPRLLPSLPGPSPTALRPLPHRWLRSPRPRRPLRSLRPLKPHRRPRSSLFSGRRRIWTCSRTGSGR